MKFTNNFERDRLEAIATDSWYGRGVSKQMVEYTFQVFSRYLRPGSTLELGPAEGLMTPLLARGARHLTLVEGSSAFCADLAKRFPAAEVINSLFEEYAPVRRFDNVVLGHVLEHVIDPVGLLRNVVGWLNPNGLVLAAVPNAWSIHRQAAVLMGLLTSEETLNEADLHHGHRRVFNPETFRAVFQNAGLTIQKFGGYWLKPLSNRQIEESWTTEMVASFMRLGEKYPDIAGELFIIADKP